MKRTTICIVTLFIMLCGCGNSTPLNDSETVNTDIVQNEIEEKTENEEFAKDITEEDFTEEEIPMDEGNSTESIENAENHIESIEEYTERIKNTYSEIKDEVAAIGAEKQEILFNGIPFGSNYKSSEKKMKKIDGYYFSILGKPIYLLSRFACGNKKDRLGRNLIEDLIETDIGACATANIDNMNVAGYSVKSCKMYFIGVLKDGKCAFSEDDSALYAASYVIENSNVESVREDLITKISSVYGEPDSIRYMEPDTMEQENIYWYGANDTMIVLKPRNEQVSIQYVWLGGEELINAVLNADKQVEENGVYGDGNTEGL